MIKALIAWGIGFASPSYIVTHGLSLGTLPTLRIFGSSPAAGAVRTFSSSPAAGSVRTFGSSPAAGTVRIFKED